MNETKLLIGSLSNDLFRVATLSQRGSKKAASKFIKEAKRWSNQLQTKDLASYIKKITIEVLSQSEKDADEELAERYLMYGILLQNYALHNLNKN